MGTYGRALVTAIVAALLVAGCANTAGTGGSPSGGSPPGGSMSPSLPPSGGPASTAEMTLTGVVEEGVEHGCLVMNSGGKTYQLVGGDPAVVRAGAHLTVRGRLSPGLMTTCMQGDPFVVSEARPS